VGPFWPGRKVRKPGRVTCDGNEQHYTEAWSGHCGLGEEYRWQSGLLWRFIGDVRSVYIRSENWSHRRWKVQFQRGNSLFMVVSTFRDPGAVHIYFGWMLWIDLTLMVIFLLWYTQNVATETLGIRNTVWYLYLILVVCILFCTGWEMRCRME